MIGPATAMGAIQPWAGWASYVGFPLQSAVVGALGLNCRIPRQGSRLDFRKVVAWCVIHGLSDKKVSLGGWGRWQKQLFAFLRVFEKWLQVSGMMLFVDGFCHIHKGLVGGSDSHS